MERFKMESPQVETKKKPAIWKKFEKYSRIVALSALLSLPGIESTFGQEKDEKEDVGAKMEKLKEEAAGHVMNILAGVKEKGQAGNIGETPVRRWETQDKKTSATVGYRYDESEAQWLIYEGNDASMRYFDKDADGSVDRVIINRENSKFFGPRQKSMLNHMMTFDSMQELAEKADLTASIKPENVTVCEIGLENGESVVKFVDFQTGGVSELSGPDALEMATMVQGGFTESMKSLDQQLGK